ncbi:MAG: hypothetical protein QOE97_890 [Pseudonocardiales bacterium]|nr:hypothetical protein [Pseudonocardiales bacterium]
MSSDAVLPAPAQWVGFAAGLALALSTWLSVIGTLIVPRPINSRISKLSGRTAIAVFAAMRRPLRTYPARDRLLAWQAPMALLLRLVLWIALLDVAYAFMLLPFVRGRLASAFDESGSSLFTLGYSAPTHSGSTTLVYIAAFSGLVVVGLQIGYLPTLYAAFNRREEEVTLLVARGGLPAWGPELLARTRFGLGTLDGSGELADLYRTWERWAADVAETHSTYLTLCWLRSPRPYSNWLISMISVMDAAALHLSLTPSTAPTLRARLVVRSGISCMQQIAGAIGLPVVDDADPNESITLTFDEFAAAVDMLQAVGFSVEVSAEQAWPHFRGWRVNYERMAYALARSIDAPPAMWSGPRRWPSHPVPPHRPANRVARETARDDPQSMPRTIDAPVPQPPTD